MKAKNLDEFCGAAPGSFMALVKRQAEEAAADEKARRERIRKARAARKAKE